MTNIKKNLYKKEKLKIQRRIATREDILKFESLSADDFEYQDYSEKNAVAFEKWIRR